MKFLPESQSSNRRFGLPLFIRESTIDKSEWSYHARWSMAMSTYVFLCQDCNKEFTKSLHMSDVEKVNLECPHCGSKKVLQAVAAFSAMTSKKS